MYKFELGPTQNNPYMDILSLIIYAYLTLIGVSHSALTNS